MSQDPNEFEAAADNHFDAVIRVGDRPRGTAGEWIRTLILCGVLLGGLLVVLPLMPDRDPRGVDTSHHNSNSNAPATLSRADEDPSLRDVVISEPVSMVRRTGDNRHHT